MKPVSQIRKENLELLIKELGSVKAVAALGETSEIYLSQIRNGALDKKTGKPRSMGNQIARRLEAKHYPGWMDEPHSDDSMSRYLNQIRAILSVIPESQLEAAALEVTRTLALFLPGGSRQT